MPIVGMRITSISGSRTDNTLKGDIKINSTPKIISLKEIEVPAGKKKALEMGFSFTTNYEPDLGKVKITGSLLYSSDENKKILKGWKKNKKLPQETDIEIMNYLFRHMLLKSANITEELQLPPPIRFPIVKPKVETSSYIG